MTTPRDETHDALCDEVIRLEDEYQEVARAMGCNTFFHKDVLERAKMLAKYWMAG